MFDVYSSKNQCAASDILPTKGCKVWGVLYDVPDNLVRGRRSNGPTLEELEGPKYHEEKILVQTQGSNKIRAVTFLVKDTERRNDLATAVWYVSWIIYGLREHSVPEDYIEHVREVAIKTNQRAARNAQKQIQIINTL
jgi:hypothetical protein